jgi:hypothetical protein
MFESDAGMDGAQLMYGQQQPQQQPIDAMSKKQIEKSLTGKSVSKLARSRLLQMMAMNAAKKNAFGGGSQNG